MADPLNFGALQPTTPYYVAKPGVPSAPPPLSVYGPPAPPAPRPIVVDRQAYLTEQLNFQRQMREYAQIEAQQRANAARALMAPPYQAQDSPLTREGAAFGQGIVDAGMTDEERLIYSKFRQSLGPAGAETFGRNVYIPPRIAGEPEGQYGSRGQIISSEGNLPHETTHAFEGQFSPQQRQQFLVDVQKAAARGDQLAARALFGGYGDFGEARAPGSYQGINDPAHVFTFIMDVAREQPNLIPPEVAPYYKGLFAAPQKRVGYRGTQWQEDDPHWTPIFAKEQRDLAQELRGDEARQKQTDRLGAALNSDEYKQKLNSIIQMGIGVGEAGIGSKLAAQKKADQLIAAQRLGIAKGTPRYEEVVMQVQAFGKILTPTEEVERGLRKPLGPSALVEPLNRDIQFLKNQVQPVVGDIGRETVGRALTGIGETLPGQLATTAINQLPGTLPSGAQAGEWIGEAIVPVNVWQAALELVPGIGTVPGLTAAVRKGSPEAILALRKAGAKLGESETVERAIRGLASESGKLEPEKFVPDNVITALKNRNKAVAKNPDDLQQAWEVLPPVNRKMITNLAEAVLTPAERKAITRAGQARQTARAREAITETAGTTLERAQAGRAAMKGRYIPQIAPIGKSFDAGEITDLFGQIDEAFDTRKLIPQEHANATDAMELLMYGKRPLSPEKPLSLMPSEIKLLGRIYGPEFEAMLPRSAAELSNFDKFIDFANLPRAVIAGVDISAPARQGIVLAARNPMEWGKAWWPMIKAMFSEQRYTRELERMQADDYFEDAVLHGIDFTDIGGGPAAEEAFQTRLIQGNVFLRNTVGRGERGYTVYLDKLRLDVYKKGAKRLERTAKKYEWEPERLDLAKKDWGGFVNHASGRGDLGGLNKYVPTMNAMFFSPRFVISRPQTVYDLVKSDPAVRQMVGENLGAFVGSGVLLMTAAAAAGAQVELDPRSSDFGKIRIGDQRIEFWGGFQPLARYIAQIATGDRKTLTSNELVGINRWKTVGKFIRSKLSPAGALGWDLAIEGGKNYEGKSFLSPNAIPTEVMNRLLPLVLQDAIEGYRSQSPAAAARAAAVSVVGGGVGTFGASEKEQQGVVKSEAQKNLTAAGYPDRDQTYTTDEGFRQKWADAFGVDEAESTFEEFRANRIAEAVSDGLTEAEAAYKFDNHKFTNLVEQQLKAGRLSFWKAHPDLLKEALDAKLTDYSQEKAKILQDANLD